MASFSTMLLGVTSELFKVFLRDQDIVVARRSFVLSQYNVLTHLLVYRCEGCSTLSALYLLGMIMDRFRNVKW
jgi:hypothetical protein